MKVRLLFIFIFIFCANSTFVPCDRSVERAIREIYPAFQKQNRLFTPSIQLNSKTCSYERSFSMSKGNYIRFKMDLPEYVSSSCSAVFDVDITSTKSYAAHLRPKADETRHEHYNLGSPVPQRELEKGCLALIEKESHPEFIRRISNMLKYQAYTIITSRIPWNLGSKVIFVISSYFRGNRQDLKLSLLELFLRTFKEELGDTFELYYEVLAEMLPRTSDEWLESLEASFTIHLETAIIVSSNLLADNSVSIAKQLSTKLLHVDSEYADKVETLLIWCVPNYKQYLSSLIYHTLSSLVKLTSALLGSLKVKTGFSKVLVFFHYKIVSTTEYLIGNRLFWTQCTVSQFQYIAPAVNSMYLLGLISVKSSDLESCHIQSRGSHLSVIKVALRDGDRLCEERFFVTPIEVTMHDQEFSSLSFCHRQRRYETI